jgi:hypothetical protein
VSRKLGCALAALLLGSILLIVLVVWLSSPSPKSQTTPTRLAQTTAAPAPTEVGPIAIGRRTKTNGCVTHGSLPDVACTPGEVLTTDAQAVCTPGYAGKVRDVSASESARVYAEYGIASHSKGQYEVDHLISLELGGSNGVANLWPEAANANPGFHEKDKVENFLHGQVCSGAISLQTAQYEIATNWVAVYDSMGP